MPNQKDTSNPYRVQSVFDALTLLEKIVSINEPLTASQIASILGDSRNRTFRLLTTLKECGYVTHQPTDRTYSPSLKMLTLGQSVSRGQPIESLARNTMKRLSNETRETVYLTCREGTESVCIATIESLRMVRIVAQPGSRWSLGKGATGTALLVGSPLHARDMYLDQHPQMEPVYERYREQIERDGVTLVDGREGTIADEGVMAMGTLIYDTPESANYALAIAWPHTRSTTDIGAIRSALIDAARSIERHFGTERKLSAAIT